MAAVPSRARAVSACGPPLSTIAWSRGSTRGSTRLTKNGATPASTGRSPPEACSLPPRAALVPDRLQPGVRQGVDPADDERVHAGHLGQVAPGGVQLLQPAEVV